jgi:hypothetical protein
MLSMHLGFANPMCARRSPSLPFMMGLAQFPYIMLLANTLHDR